MNKILNYLVRGIMITSVCLSVQAVAADAKPVSAEGQISIDVPVTLKEANVVFNMDHIALNGDLPIGMKYMELLNKKNESGQNIRENHWDISRASSLHDAE